MNDDWEEVDPARSAKPKASPSSPAAAIPLDTEMPTGSLTLPPGAGLIQSLVGQLPYWGMARTIRACRKMMEEKGALVTATTQLGQALLEHEKQKALWENRTAIVEAVKVEVGAKLDRAYQSQAEATLAREDAEAKLAAARRSRAQNEETNAAHGKADFYEAKRRADEAQRRYEDRLDGSDSSFRREMQQMNENKRNYEVLMKEKAADIERYGGEDKIPDFLRAFYDNLEDKLSFLKE